MAEKQEGNVPKNSKGEEKESILKEIMAISGHPGLFRFISQARNGIIVESLETGKRMQAFSTMKISALEEISIYTEEEEVSLEEVLKIIYEKESGSETINHKSDPQTLKDYFSEVLPGYDRERVYVSDIKKILNWYHILLKYELLDFDQAGDGKDEQETKQEAEQETKQEAEQETKQEPEQETKQEVEQEPKQEAEQEPKQEAEQETKQDAGSEKENGSD